MLTLRILSFISLLPIHTFISPSPPFTFFSFFVCFIFRVFFLLYDLLRTFLGVFLSTFQIGGPLLLSLSCPFFFPSLMSLSFSVFFFLQVLRIMVVSLHQAALTSARAQTVWCVAATGGCTLCPRAFPRTPVSCESWFLQCTCT